jgi:hypothetical protein
MAILLTEQQKATFQNAKEFALSYIAPRAAAWEEGRKLPRELVDELIARKYIGLLAPKALGGGEMSVLDAMLIYEGIAHGDGGAGFFTELMSVIIYPLARDYADHPFLKRHLTDFVTGRKLSCFAFTEPDAGTSCGGMTAT